MWSLYSLGRREEFLKHMVKTLGIAIDIRPKRRLRKMESYTNRKIRMCYYSLGGEQDE